MESQRSDAGFLPRDDLYRLIELLRDRGYTCIGPVEQDGALVYEQLAGPDQLPRGIRVHQAPGHYRLEQTDSRRCFAWSNGPQALKPLVFAPREMLWSVNRQAGGGLAFTPGVTVAKPTAVIGVRACDLAALELQDRHFLHGDCPDPHYRARREALFLVAINCTHPADTCFCASTGDGPACTAGFDLLLDELDEGYRVIAGSQAGCDLLRGLATAAMTAKQEAVIERQKRQAAAAQTRRLPAADLQQRLFDNLDHPHWQDVANRCLACGNCTAVCPSCFCYHEQDTGTLDLEQSEHFREWDSCFTQGHSYIHGFTVRASTALRYRQWVTHKLGSWHSQYGRSGCVGCGRCISWCPVGIDITEEVAAVVGAG